MITKENFNAAIEQCVNEIDAAESCYELAKQMAISFHVWATVQEEVDIKTKQFRTTDDLFTEWQNSKQSK